LVCLLAASLAHNSYPALLAMPFPVVLGEILEVDQQDDVVDHWRWPVQHYLWGDHD